MLLSEATADSALSFTPNVTLGPNMVKGTAYNVDTQTLGKYIQVWYGLIIGTVGILASIMIMYGGIKWLTSRGGSAVNEAKDIIISALIGLTLAFLSFTILYLINPNLLNIGLPGTLTAIKYDTNFNIAPINPSDISIGKLTAGGGGSLSPEVARNMTDYLAKHEGYVTDKKGNPVVYDDGQGNLTAGTGHLLRKKNNEVAENDDFTVTRNGQTMQVTGANVKLGDIITTEQANAWFADDISTRVNDLRGIMPNFDNLPPEAQSVAMDVTFQWGQTGTNDHFPGFYDAIESGNYSAAAAAINKPEYADKPAYRQRYTDNINALNRIK